MQLGDPVEIELADSTPSGGGVVGRIRYGVVDIWVPTRDGMMTIAVPRDWMIPNDQRWKVQLRGLGSGALNGAS
jgi:hypothetical protein